MNLKRRIDEIDRERDQNLQDYISSLKPPKMILALSELDQYRNEGLGRVLITVIGIAGGLITSYLCFFKMDVDITGFTGCHIVMLCCSVIFFLLPIYMTYHDKKLLKEQKKRIQDEIDNFEKNKKNKIQQYEVLLDERRRYLIESMNGSKINHNISNFLTVPYCPMCGSTSLKRINTAILGTQGRRTFQCNHCGHGW